jgi:hypothetical protein
MKTIYELYRDNLVADGGVPATGDSTFVLLRKWTSAAGGNPRPGDTKNVLLQKLARAKGTTVFPGDSDVMILRRIAGWNSSDNEWWCLFRILGAGNPAPTIDAPVATAASGVGPTEFVCNWLAVSGAVTYLLDVSTSPVFASFLPFMHDYAVTAPTVSQFVLIGVTPGNTYYYRVRATDGVLTSGYSNTISLST